MKVAFSKDDNRLSGCTCADSIGEVNLEDARVVWVEEGSRSATSAWLLLKA